MDERPFTAASFDQFLSERKLMAARCSKCGSLWCPPRSICNKCNSDEMQWIELQGKGKLAAFTAIEVGTTMMMDAGYDNTNPYCSGIVELEEGPMISAQILGVDASNPDDIAIGTPLQLDFIERGTFSFSKDLSCIQKLYPAFRPIG